MAGKVLSQGQVQSSWQVQHFRIAAGAALSQGADLRGRRSTFAGGLGEAAPPMMLEDVMIQQRVR